LASTEVMFKKVMEVPDTLIIRYYELTTDEHPDEIDKIKAALTSGSNPRDIKYRLAKIITQQYHGSDQMKMAVDYYDAAFSKKDIPDNIPELILDMEKDNLGDIIPALIKLDFVKSRSEFLRLLNQGGVKIEGEKVGIDDLNRVLIHGDIIKIGKKRFLRFIK